MTWMQAAIAYNVALGVFHVGFWRLFKWKERLAVLDYINRCVMQILNLKLTYVFFMIAVLAALIDSSNAKGLIPCALLTGMAIFWMMRSGEQVWFFGLKNLYSNLLLIVFIVGAVVHTMAAMSVSE